MCHLELFHEELKKIKNVEPWGSNWKVSYRERERETFGVSLLSLLPYASNVCVCVCVCVC